MTEKEMNDYCQGLYDVPFNTFIRDKWMKKYGKPGELEEICAAFLTKLESDEEEMFRKIMKLAGSCAEYPKWWEGQDAAGPFQNTYTSAKHLKPEISCDAVWTMWMARCGMMAIAARDHVQIRRVMGIRKGLFTE